MIILPVTEKGTLYEQFDRMRVRPGMWLGEATLTAMWHFTHAYQLALLQHGIEEQLDPPFEGFHEFCARYFKAPAEAGWCKIILANHFGQEDEALGQFFALFAMFRDRVDVMKGRRIVTAFAREIAFNQSHWRRELADFDAVLATIQKPLCASFRARIAWEYDAVLRDLEVMAEASKSLQMLLNHAVMHSRPSVEAQP